MNHKTRNYIIAVIIFEGNMPFTVIIMCFITVSSVIISYDGTFLC